MPLAGFDPLVAEWFEKRFGRPTEPQTLGWPEIRSGRDVLISAPTGSGKTLAAFLLCLDGLVRQARSGELPDETVAVYVSPLKALSNDIQKNLEGPLGEICELAKEKGVALAPIRTAVRTGDTKVWERQQMASKPPHILVTTPESLFILLTARRGREALRTVRTVIVDEIHAVADDKRGSHLALSLERLEHIATGGAAGGARRLQRIGLSATVKPIGEVAQFLSRRFGAQTGGPQADGGGGHIVQVGHRRAMELAVEVPKDELGVVAGNEMWEEIYDRLAALIRENRTTLLFVNTRRLAERVTHHLQERLGADVVLPHHGSLSRKLRLDAEEKLKNGELRAVVATASLELGIDIGTVDMVCQLGSPRSIAVALQRFGRAGHWVGATPKARLFATTRDELLECAALIRAIHDGELDRLEIPDSPLDVLAQQIVAETACQEWGEDALFERVRSTYAYRGLSREKFDAVVEMLSEGISSARGRSAAYLHRDQVNHRLKGRRNARLAAITSGGAIPDTAQYRVVAEPDGATVGSLDEDFAVESMAGDIFLLGTTSWRIRRVETGVVRVEDAHGAAPTIPFWRGEAPGRTIELSREVSRLRQDVADWLDKHNVRPADPGQSPETQDPSAGGSAGADRPLPEFLFEQCRLDRRGAEQAAGYIQAGRRSLGALPTQQTIVAERFFDESGGMQLIVHAPFGSRINRAWGLALRKRFCRSFNLELQAAATDNGINISLTEQHAFPLEMVFEFLRPATLEHVLTQALLASPMFTARWRWNLSRALAVLRFSGGRKVPPPLQRMRAEDLLAGVFPDQAACAENLSGEIRIPDHPLVNETIDNCLHEAMDLDGLRQVIEGILDGRIRTEARETAEPSPFSHEILNANPYAFLDDAPLEERRARAVQMRRSLGGDFVDGFAALDPAAIAQIEEEVWPLVRDADELHDALLTLVTAPPRPDWQEFFDTLVNAGRATVLDAGQAAIESNMGGLPGRTQSRPTFWVAAERLALAKQAHPTATCRPPVGAIDSVKPLPDSRQACITEVLRGWLDSTGPTTAAGLAGRLALPVGMIDQALLQLESEGQVLRGRFRPSPTEKAAQAASPSENGSAADIEWCNRRVLARIHRLTLGRLRREIQPVSTADFMRFLGRWQHAAPTSRLHGVDGTLEVIRQLQGYEIPAAAWEADILPRRVANYKPDLLDRLCLSGEVVWGRLSPHPAFEPAPQENGGANASRSKLRNGASRLPGNAAKQDGDGAAGPEPATGTPPSETRQRRVRPTRVAPISLFLREDAPSLFAEARIIAVESAAPAAWDRNKVPLSHPAREVLSALEARGACFFADLVRTTRRLPSEVEDGLWELVAAGLVTADGFENLRALIDPKRRRGEGRGRAARPRHAAGRWAQLSEILVEEHPAPALATTPAVAMTPALAMTPAVAAPQELAETGMSSPQPPQPESGEAEEEDAGSLAAGLPPRPPATPVEAFARQVLKRWGVVFRDILQRESLAPPWRDLLMVLRRLEARGEIRGGRFVEAFRGEQFALSEAVDALRAIRRAEPSGEEIAISTADPLNLAGIILPGPRLAASTAGTVRLRDGKLVEQPPAAMLPQPSQADSAKPTAGAVA